MAFILRGAKGSPLTHDELDGNFQELFYSSSFTSHSITLFKSKSLEGEVTFPINTARGPKYAVQFKIDGDALGTGSLATGSSDLLFDYNSKKLIITGSGDITGNLIVGGTVTAQEFKSELVNSSVIYESGSTKFGDTSDDNHAFTGSVQVLGNITTDGGITGSDVYINGWTSVSSSLSANYQYSVNTSASLASTINTVSQSIDNRIESVSQSIDTRLELVSSSLASTDNAFSSSAATALTAVSSSITTTVSNVSASLAATINNNSSSAATSLQSVSASLASTISSDSGSVSSDISALSSSLLTTITALSSSVSNTYLQNTTDSFTGDLDIVGSITASRALFTDIVVNGTGSFAIIESITGSAKIIGDEFISLNSNTPAARYAGLKVFDSGSNNTTASLQFDGLNNDWFYEYEGTVNDYALALFGPGYSTKGSATTLTQNTIPKASGSHHLNDSNITDDGTTVDITAILSLPGITNVSESIASSVSATGANWNTNLINIPSGLISSSAQTANNLPSGLISSSAQIASDISGSFTAGTGLDLSSGQFSIDVSDFMNGGVDNRVLTATSADSIAGEANLTFDGSTLSVTGDIDATGDITAYASSDERLKDNITPISNPIDKVKAIGGYTYNWNGLQDKHILGTQDVGVIAQEIEDVLPELVATRESGYKAVRYEKIVALLIEAIKDQQSQIDDLKSRL